VIGELGHFALIVAFVLALLQGVLPLAGAQRGVGAWMALAAPAARAQFGFVVVAYACLTAAFVGHDFSLAVVASHSNTLLPTPYRVAAVWGGHEGSMLLWVLMLALWTVAVTFAGRRLPPAFGARVLGVMGLLSSGFIAFLLFTSNPFARLLPAPTEGRDLNPLLQDPGMVLHPPLLYMGYVGFSVAFAFAIAALLSGRLDAAWAKWSRPWTTLAWVFLTLGIALGSWWAYYELGWGGWWFWDPVENASFLPWLAGTALIHSLAVTEKRGAFRSWTVLLAILAFSCSLLGTFLVRSGVLTSVHAFATDPARGVFILGFLVLVIGSALALFAWRAPRVGLGAGFSALSRESLLLANNVLLAVAAASVLLGTLYPLLLDALGLGKISVGPPYFEAVFAPLMAPAVFLLGIGPLLRWREAPLAPLLTRLRWAFAVSVVAGVATALLGGGSALSALGVSLAAWVAATTLAALLERVRPERGAPLAQLALLPRAQWGMLAAHLGVGVFVFGVTMVKSFEAERDVRLAPGESATLGAYTFRFDGAGAALGPNYRAVRATVQVSRDGRPVATLHAEKRLYAAQGSPMTEAAIDSGLTRDLYVSLGEPVGPTAWAMRLQVKPFVDWIWGGCALMALGGLLAATDRRYRAARRAAAAADAALPLGARA
jgi:cytochrome c-type biogenesis protein CcmF